jgi:molybdopterin/thiamine biosynthesis adenylyltransferase
VYVCDWVLRDIGREIGAHPPERGGARHRPLVTRFLPDPLAEATAASWRPSRALDGRVKDVERDEGLELKGVVHSHPLGLDRPSGQDALELAEGLRLNGHMALYLSPVVTREPPGELAPHELPMPPGKISFFAGFRSREGPAAVLPLPVRAVPLLRDLERVARDLGGGAPEVLLCDLGAGPVPAGRLRLEGGIELLVAASELYPSLPPIVLATPAGGETAQVPLHWRIETPEEDRLALALRPSFAPPGPYRRAFGPPGCPALTADAERARLAGWEARFTGEDPAAAAGSIGSALLARGAGLLSAKLQGRTALVAGCGSVGSYVAEQLVRSGLGGVALLDPEAVEAANLSRTAYDLRDVGLAKVAALARRLAHVQPALRIAQREVAVEALAPAELDALVRGADLVLAATDDPAAQRTLNRFAYARGKPALFVGLYAGARGGEVVVSVPERTPCYLCATRARHLAEQASGSVARDSDYGTGRLAAEVALGADVQHVASAAVKLGLSLLLSGDDEALLGEMAEGVLAQGTTYLTMSTVPRYWFYPEVFRDVPGQGAYQSVWLAPTRSAECPVCGDAGSRADPLDAPLRAPRSGAFPGGAT